MIRIEPYRADHLAQLIVENAQAWLQPLVDDRTYAESLQACGPFWTALAGDTPIGVAGVYEAGGGRAVAHALLASNCGPHLTAITRAVQRFLEVADYDRIEAQVLTRRAECHRWARMLGFSRECTMRRYQNGDDFDLYARVR